MNKETYKEMLIKEITAIIMDGAFEIEYQKDTIEGPIRHQFREWIPGNVSITIKQKRSNKYHIRKWRENKTE